ncbi:MAG: LysM peptidoglycan-binding protein [Frankiales bacterium]|nr:LysM peptidoglycan-binding protein [Frankiales bacterium]
MQRSVRTACLLVLLTAVVTASAPSLIRIKPGDTLSALALRHHTTVAKLQAANHLRGTTIYAGALLRLPGNATPAQETTTRRVSHVYTVRPGDTLIGLASRFGTTPKALAARNRLHSTMLLIGQRLSYGVTVRTAAPAARVAGSVAQSAARHRAILRTRTLPSRAAVGTMIRAAARRHGVPTSLALAVAYHESGFQQRVVSPVDAIGVMQVLPSTGRSLGRIHGRSYNLLKASDNIEAGVTLLRDLLRATGSAPRAMAGYYQGLGSVARIGLLPQTHAYIRNVQALQTRFA